MPLCSYSVVNIPVFKIMNLSVFKLEGSILNVGVNCYLEGLMNC